MKIEIIKCLQDNYSYLIIDETNKNACVVDPSEAKPVINFIENNQINLKYILNTHHHYDHVGGNLELKKRYNSVVVGYKHDAKRIPEISNEIPKIERNNSLLMGNLPPIQASGAEKIIIGRTFFQGIKLFSW